MAVNPVTQLQYFLAEKNNDWTLMQIVKDYEKQLDEKRDDKLADAIVRFYNNLGCYVDVINFTNSYYQGQLTEEIASYKQNAMFNLLPDLEQKPNDFSRNYSPESTAVTKLSTDRESAIEPIEFERQMSRQVSADSNKTSDELIFPQYSPSPSPEATSINSVLQVPPQFRGSGSG